MQAHLSDRQVHDLANGRTGQEEWVALQNHTVQANCTECKRKVGVETERAKQALKRKVFVYAFAIFGMIILAVGIIIAATLRKFF